MDDKNVVHIHKGILFSYKENKIIKFAAKQMDLEEIILNDLTQTQKDKHHTYPFIWQFPAPNPLIGVYNMVEAVNQESIEGPWQRAGGGMVVVDKGKAE